MRRRDFIKWTVPAAFPFLVGGLPLKAFGGMPLFNDAPVRGSDSDRVLVLIYLKGGNDGLNTVIPLDQYEAYRRVRPDIGIDRSEILQLTGSVGLHPAMQGLRDLYSTNRLCILQGVGYPGPVRSHAQSEAFWITGTPNSEKVATGWLGRYLDARFPGYPAGYPNASMTSPLAVQFGSDAVGSLRGESGGMGVPYFNVPPKFASASVTRYAAEMTRWGTDNNRSYLYPPPRANALADSLRTIARLIASGSRTPVYVVTLSGFDTHARQVEGGAGAVAHGRLLGQLAVAVKAFQHDIELMGVADRVVGMTFSEFGRSVSQNASGGTDHGMAAPQFLFGTNVVPGIIGNNLDIKGAAPGMGVPLQFDFRSVYASILTDWFGVTRSDCDGLLYGHFPALPVIETVSRGVGASATPASSSGRLR